MKKTLIISLFSVCVLLLTSCTTFAALSGPLDHGYYSANGVEAEEKAAITVDSYIEITGIDSESSIFGTGVTGWSQKVRESQLQKFSINPGLHTFSVKYNSGRQFTPLSNLIIANLEANKSYIIVYNITGTSVSYDVLEEATSKSALFDFETLQGKSENYMSKFIDKVLNPTMEGSDKIVIEQNDDFILTSLPGMKYTLYNKQTNETQKGFRGFVTDLSFSKGTVYLYETDEIETKEEFLETDYQSESGIVLEVRDCDSETVTYTYIKPEEFAGKTIKFKILAEE